jgi:hypothetical protein
VVFAALQTTGCILASYGTVYSDSAFVRGSWLVGFFLLLPGDLPAMAVAQTLIHARTAYIFFPVAVTSNAMLWIMCSALWRTLRRTTPKSATHSYTSALAATGLVFVTANTVHFLRRATCADCFFPYGLPFTLYHDGGFAGGAGFVWGGLAVDIGCVLVVALLVGCFWERRASTRVG